LNDDICWNHVAIVRENTRVTLYINGEFAAQQGTLSRIDLFNNGYFTIGNAICKSNTETGFGGLIDELRVYNRSLDAEEVEGLYFSPDKIINRDTNIFLGSAVNIELTNTCAEDFNWTPAGEVASPFDAEPVITPKVAGAEVYTIEMTDLETGCVARDSVRINVVDPNDLECDVVYLPKAFTPNGDNLNDTYGISNPFAIQELISFEIYDRWGGRVFATDSAFERWDGSFNGDPVNPGVMIYKVIYKCDDVERQTTGSFTILK
jgi:gliding motility-associated-like protein